MKFESWPQSSKCLQKFCLTSYLRFLDIRISLATKSRSWKNAHLLYVSLWSMPTEETYCRKSPLLVQVNSLASVSRLYGHTLSKCSMVCKPCMTGKSCIVTSSAQMCFWPKMVWSSSVTWMWVRSLSEDFCRRRRAHRTMRALKSGKTSPTTTRAISGPWDAYCLKCAHFSPRSAQMTWTSYSREYAKAKCSPCQPNTRKT